MTLVELILAPHSAYAGKTIKEMNFRRKYGFTVLAILRRGRSYRTDVGDMSLEPGDSLLIVGPPRRLRDLRINPDIIIFEPDPAARPVPRRRAVISVLVFACAVVLALLGLPVYLAVIRNGFAGHPAWLGANSGSVSIYRMANHLFYRWYVCCQSRHDQYRAGFIDRPRCD